MIEGLSKYVTLYLAPVLGLAAVLLAIFAFFAPTLLLHDQVSLFSITPSTALVEPSSTQGVDGPSVFFGMFGSCARGSNSAGVACTAPTISPRYDVSSLPSNAPSFLLSPPASATPAFISVGLVLSFLFLISFTMISFRQKLGTKTEALMDKPNIQRLSAWTGFVGFIVGIASFLFARMWFGKAVLDFNANILSQGKQGPKLIANVGNAFTMVWVAYAFFSVPVIVSISKLNVQATK